MPHLAAEYRPDVQIGPTNGPVGEPGRLIFSRKFGGRFKR